MQALSTLKAFFLLALFAPIFMACGDDTTGPDDVTYPVTMKPTSVTNKSAVRAFVREGNTWREITSENPEILTNEYFAESSVIETDDDATLVLTSSTKWESPAAPGTTFSYSYSRNKFTFNSLLGINFYGTGDYSQFKQHMAVGVSFHTDGIDHDRRQARISYDPAVNPIDALLAAPIIPLTSEEGDTLAYQTFDIVYEVE